IREVFLQQNAYDAVDTYCDMTKQYEMMKAIKKFSDLAYAAQVAGALPAQIMAVPSKNELPQIKFIKDYKPALAKILDQMDTEVNALRSGT
ncbi:MAG: V-type ATP synthase subunit A, partial [Methanomicrobiales archaeon]|nr:V-type ATP synthase subunit A [Methanomicrobiales archaeon]